MKPETGKLKAERLKAKGKTLKCGLASLRLATVLLTLAFSLYPLAFPLRAAQFFVDSVTGSDANTSAQAQFQTTPWAHLPGMSGATGNAAGYSVQGGDSFCLKGGSTWTRASAPDDNLVITVSGITIQGGQRLATPWGSGYPVIDGTGAAGTRRGIYATGINGVTVDGVKFYNQIYAADGSGYGILVSGGSGGWEIKNCYFQMCGVCSVSVNPGDGANFSFHNNTVIDCGRTEFQPEAITFDSVNIYSNLFLGIPNYDPVSYHCDGIMLGSECTAYPSTLTNIRIHHNTFRGQWSEHGGATALIYLNDSAAPSSSSYSGGYHAYIYDNQCCIDTDGSISPALLFLDTAWKDVQVYNNTFACTTTVNPISCAVSEFNMKSDAGFVLTNNIFCGTANGVNANLSHGAGLECDYNLYFTSGGNHLIWDQNNRWDTLADARAAGYEAHGVLADPKFVALPNGTTGSGNWHLQPGSPATGAGFNLGSPYNVDLDGNTRTAPWSLGAFVAPGLGASINGGRINGGVILH